MSLKFKLLLFITLFSFFPISLLGGYQSFSRYRTQMAETRNSLSGDLRAQQEIFARFADGACQDIEFVSQVMEVAKLLTGVADEDNDEIEYWTESLTNVFLSFVENRKKFKEIRFSVAEDGVSRIAIRYEGGKAAGAEVSGPSPGLDPARSAAGKPYSFWHQGEGGAVLWLHYPVQVEETTGTVSAFVDLERLYALAMDREIHLRSQQTGVLISAGQAVSGGPQPQSAGPDNSSGISETDDAIYSSTTFALLKWTPDEEFTLYKKRAKSQVMAPIRTGILEVIAICILATLGGVCTGYLFLSRALIAPLTRATLFANTIAGGDLGATLSGIRSGDEIGMLAAALNNMAATLSGMIRDMGASVTTLTDAGTEMTGVALQLNENSEGTALKAGAVAEAAQEMTMNMDSVAAAVEESSASISTISAATQQMSANIGDIAVNVDRAKESTVAAVDLAKNASDHVRELGGSAEEIGVISDTITAISQKTNLLALNATIEAARAGEAGRGFAVVAGEIKDLACQTNEATADIAGRLAAIGRSTRMTVDDIKEISGAIGSVDGIVTAIADAVTEQTAATREISENIGQTSMGVREITENVAQTSLAAGKVAKEIGEVNDAAGDIGNSSSRVNRNARSLNDLSGQLGEKISLFRVEGGKENGGESAG